MAAAPPAPFAASRNRVCEAIGHRGVAAIFALTFANQADGRVRDHGLVDEEWAYRTLARPLRRWPTVDRFLLPNGRPRKTKHGFSPSRGDENGRFQEPEFLLGNATPGIHGNPEHGFTPRRGAAKRIFPFFAPLRLGEKHYSRRPSTADLWGMLCRASGPPAFLP